MPPIVKPSEKEKYGLTDSNSGMGLRVYINSEGEVFVENPYPYGPAWVTYEEYNCMKEAAKPLQYTPEYDKSVLYPENEKFKEINNKMSGFEKFLNSAGNLVEEQWQKRVVDPIEKFRYPYIVIDSAVQAELTAFLYAFKYLLTPKNERTLDDLIYTTIPKQQILEARSELTLEEAEKYFSYYKENYKVGKYVEDFGISPGDKGLTFEAGATVVVDTENGMVVKYLHEGMGYGASFSPADYQITTAEITGGTYDSYKDYEGFFLQFIGGALVQINAATGIPSKDQVFSKEGWENAVKKEGAGIMQNIGVALTISDYEAISVFIIGENGVLEEVDIN